MQEEEDGKMTEKQNVGIQIPIRLYETTFEGIILKLEKDKGEEEKEKRQRKRETWGTY